MKVLVIGGAGYIGAVCVEELVKVGHEVIVFDNLSEGFKTAVDPSARLQVGCLSQREDIARVVSDFRPETVIHFAALARVGESMEQPGRYFENNVAYGLNLLDACVRFGVRKIVFSSTCATYGIPVKTPIDESHPQNPINPYGESKVMFERILHWHHVIHGLEFVAFRYFNAAGASKRYGQSHREMTHIIPSVLKVVQGQRKQCTIYGTDYPTPDGTCIRDYIHIYDLAQAHLKAMAPGPCGYFNLGVGHGYSVKEVISTCEAVTGVSIPYVEKPRRAGDPPELIADASKARATFGWAPRYPDLKDIVASAWDWHQRYPVGYLDA